MAPDVGVVSDPIFSQAEPDERPVRARALVFQFFLVPLMIVVAAVGVFLFFGAIAGTRDTPGEVLDAVVGGSDSVQKQSAHQLGVLIGEERKRVDARKDPETPPFWEQAGFREKLRRAFVESFPDRSLERRAFLALALGRVGDPSYLPTLRDHLGTTAGGAENPPAVRVAVVQAIGLLQGDDAVPVLLSLLSDAEEPVRNHAVEALSRHDGPEVRAGLRRALEDASPYVRLNAGAALARFGDPAGVGAVRELLDEAAVRRLIEEPTGSGDRSLVSKTAADLRRAFVSNGIRGALALKDDALRPLVARFADDGDPAIRELARSALDRWPTKP